jgi:hypothetical protein
MRTITMIGLVLCLGYSWTQGRGGEERPPPKASRLASTHSGFSVEQKVRSRLCFAGRYRVEKVGPGEEATLRLLERAPSNEYHPNASGPEEVVVFLSAAEKDPGLKAGGVYCLVLSYGTKRGLTVEAFGEDDAGTVQELKELMRSPRAFLNDERSRKRQKLWASFKRDAKDQGEISVYGENEKLDRIVFLRRETGGRQGSFPYRYKMETGKVEVIATQLNLPLINRITWEGDSFLLWHDGNLELAVD